MCYGAEENQAHHWDFDKPRVQKQPLFLVCCIIAIFTHMERVPLKQKLSDDGADQK